MNDSFDLIIDINDIGSLPDRLGINKSDIEKDYLEIIPQYDSDFQAFVPVMNGCNNFCAYCVVRGFSF